MKSLTPNLPIYEIKWYRSTTWNFKRTQLIDCELTLGPTKPVGMDGNIHYDYKNLTKVYGKETTKALLKRYSVQVALQTSTAMDPEDRGLYEALAIVQAIGKHYKFSLKEIFNDMFKLNLTVRSERNKPLAEVLQKKIGLKSWVIATSTQMNDTDDEFDDPKAYSRKLVQAAPTEPSPLSNPAAPAKEEYAKLGKRQTFNSLITELEGYGFNPSKLYKSAVWGQSIKGKKAEDYSGLDASEFLPNATPENPGGHLRYLPEGDNKYLDK